MPKRIITIYREFCSGGHEVGKKLAQSLNIDFYDKELISLSDKKERIITAIIQSLNGTS